MSKLALKMAKPAGVKLAIKTVDEGIALLNNPSAKNTKIFVIVRTIQDTLKMVKATDQIRKVNIGGVKNKEGGKMIAAAVCVNDQDLRDLKELKGLVEHLELRMVPTENCTNIDKFL